MARRTPPTRRVDAPRMRTLAGLAAAGLIASWLFGGFGHGLRGMDPGRLDLLVGGGIVILLMIVRRRRAASAPATPAAGDVPDHVEPPSGRAVADDHPSGDSAFDRGVRDIRRTDPGFKPDRFAGYAAMVFRDAHSAWMRRDLASLHDRVTPQMHRELQAECDRLRSARRVNRLEQIEVKAEIAEAWQESGRDYVTAHIGGSIVDYTVDEATDRLVGGSRTTAVEVGQFWTFTRPAGLNFWMLSAIQTS